MFGKVAFLDKPMVLIKKLTKKVEIKVQGSDDSEEENESTEKMMQGGIEYKTETEYVIEAVIRRKILFNKRPRPIVSLETKIKF